MLLKQKTRDSGVGQTAAQHLNYPMISETFLEFYSIFMLTIISLVGSTKSRLKSRCLMSGI